MNKKQIMLLIMVAILGIGITTIGYYSYYVVDKFSDYAEVDIAKNIGINTETQPDFGKLKPGTSSTKTLNLTNNFDFPVRVDIKINGNLGKITVPDNNDFWLKPYENKLVVFTASAPTNIEYGKYSGDITVMLLRW